MAQKFAVFDIDGTLIRWQLYHAVVHQLIKENKLPKTIGESIEAARMTWKRRSHSSSYNDYEHHLWQSYLAAVSNLSVKDLDTVIDEVFKTYKDQVYTYTRDLIRQLKDQGYLLFAISGSHHEIVDKLAKYYGFTDSVGTQYSHENGIFTGSEIAVTGRKDEALKELVNKHAASWKDSVAIGDSKSDAKMLELVDNPIAFNPNQELFAIAQKAGWKVVIERKNMIYEMESHDGSYILA